MRKREGVNERWQEQVGVSVKRTSQASSAPRDPGHSLHPLSKPQRESRKIHV